MVDLSNEDDRASLESRFTSSQNLSALDSPRVAPNSEALSLDTGGMGLLPLGLLNAIQVSEKKLWQGLL